MFCQQQQVLAVAKEIWRDCLYNIDRPNHNQNLVRTVNKTLQSGLAHRVCPNDKRNGINRSPLKTHHFCGTCF